MDYVIIGNGGFAKEVYFLASEVLGKEWTFKGFIDYHPANKTGQIGQEVFPVIDEDDFLQHNTPDSDLAVFLGIGNPGTIKKVIQKFNGFFFPNLIHPTAVLHKSSVTMGQGNIITAGCILTVDIVVGSYNILNLNTTIGHDTRIGDGNVFNPGVNISGGVEIQNFNLVGTNATVLQYLKIGSGNTMGASCLITKNVEDNQLMVGVPAKPFQRNNA